VDKSTMLFDQMLENPFVKRAISAGEERMGKVVGRLLADERVTSGLQNLITSASHARDRFDRSVRQALHAVNLPSSEDVEALKRRLDDLEATLDGLAKRIGRARDRRGPA
jgi:poly(hydroxyalkanoate) granule associated protein phasin